MKEFLSTKGIAFEEKDVASDTEAREFMKQKSGLMAVPQVQVDEQMVVGFDRHRLEQLLQ